MYTGCTCVCGGDIVAGIRVYGVYVCVMAMLRQIYVYMGCTSVFVVANLSVDVGVCRGECTCSM